VAPAGGSDGGPIVNTAAIEVNPAVRHGTADVLSRNPTPASEPEREPLGDHEAYLAGLNASQSGVDLSDLVYIAFASWPGTSREACSAIASAAVGWCANEWREAGRDEP
jgi:hypothetical protein